MAYTGKKPIDHTDVTQSQSMTVTDDLTVDTNTLHVDSTNNRVGIGTALPDSTLSIENTTSSGATIKYDGQSNGEFGLRIQSNVSGGNFESDFAVGGTALLDLFANSSTTSGGDFLVARTQASDPVLLVKGNGRVGIGTSSPASELHVKGSAYTPITIDGTSGGTIDFYRNGSRHAQIFTNNAGGDIIFRNNTTTERLRIQSGGGISFNGDTAAANALDDYEEGTFTATLTAATTAPSTPPTATGNYTKIGNLVNCRVVFSAANTTGGAGYILVTGLPFSASSAGAYGDIMLHTLASFNSETANVATYISGTSVVPYQSLTTSGWASVTLNATSLGYLYFSATYPTSS